MTLLDNIQILPGIKNRLLFIASSLVLATFTASSLSQFISNEEVRSNPGFYILLAFALSHSLSGMYLSTSKNRIIK